MKYAQSNLIIRLIRKRDIKSRMVLDDGDGFLMEAMLPLYAKMSRAKGGISNEWRLSDSGWLTLEQAKGCMVNA